MLGRRVLVPFMAQAGLSFPVEGGVYLPGGSIFTRIAPANDILTARVRSGDGNEGSATAS